MDKYTIALWRSWPSDALPIVSENPDPLCPIQDAGWIEAETHLDALFSLMRAHHLKKVAYAAIGLTSGTILRYQDVMLPQEEVSV